MYLCINKREIHLYINKEKNPLNKMGVPSGEQERKGDSREGQGVGRRCDAPRGAALEAVHLH
jgi:hypothetical protein